MDLKILGAQMALSCEQHLDVLRRSIEDGGEITGRHVETLDALGKHDI